MMQTQRYVKTSEDRYFKNLDVVVSDQWLLIGHNEYDLTAVSSSEVVSEPGERNWPVFLRTQVGFIAVLAVAWAIASYFNWWIAGPILVFWVLETVTNIWREFRRSLQYTLVLNTNTGLIRVATNKSGDGLAPVALEINKRIDHLQLTGPLLPIPPLPVQGQSGEPTKWIQANWPQERRPASNWSISPPLAL